MNEAVPLDYEASSPTAPAALKVVAWLFIISGVFTILQIIIDLTHRKITFDTGFLGVFIGPGLLRFRPGWRTCALVLLWLWIILAPILWVFAFSTVRVTTIAFFGLQVGTAPVWVGFVVGVAVYALAVWEYRVLVREEVRLLFGLPPRS